MQDLPSNGTTVWTEATVRGELEVTEGWVGHR